MSSVTTVDELRQVQRDVTTSQQKIKHITATMESYRQEITTYGMSSPIAEAIESAFPGAITHRARLNAFTRYPSPVNEAVGLEAIFNIKSEGLRKLIYGLIAAAIAGAALLVGYLVKMFRGQEADQRRARAADPRIFRIDPTAVGTSNPQWIDDPAYRGGVDNFVSKLSKVLLTLASGRCDSYLNEVYQVKPPGMLYIISNEVTDGIVALNTAMTEITRLSKLSRGEIRSEDTERVARELVDALDHRKRVIMAMRLPGTADNDPLNIQIEDYLHELSQQVTESGITKPLFDDEVYEYGMRVTKAEKSLEGIDHKALADVIAKSGNSLTEQRRKMLANVPDVSADTLDLVSQALDTLKDYIDMQQNLMNIYVVMSDAVITAERAFCELLTSQLDAMTRAGVDFESNPNDKHFYTIITNYLNK